MNRTRLGIALSIVPTLLGPGCGRGPDGVGTTPPAVSVDAGSIVVITLDTLRADRLGTYHYVRDTSPFIDAFAEEAVVFENAYTTMSTTLPAHVSLFTSMHPLQTGIVANNRKFNAELDAGIRFFAQIMRAYGYETAGFVSATPVKTRSGIAAGFNSYDEPPRTVPQRPGNVTADRALTWLAGNTSEPFFLWIHYFDTHEPREPPPPFATKFRIDDRLIRFLDERGTMFSDEEDILEQNNLYDGEVGFLDSQVGRVLAALRARPDYDDLTIVIVSDHGEGLGQHGTLAHGRLYNEQLQVALIVKFKTRLGWNGTRRSEIASIVDVVPTIMASMGLPIDDRMQQQFEGIDLMSGDRARDHVFAHRTPRRSRRWGKGQKYTLVTPDWKYHYSTDLPDELYDMRGDRAELDNRLDAEPEVARRMKDTLLGLIATYSRTDSGMEVLESRSKETLEELRSLGYVR